MTNDNVVTAREFFREPYKYLKELPVVVTVRNMNKYVVTEYEDHPAPSVPVRTSVVTKEGEVVNDVVTSKPITEEPKLCEHFRIKSICKQCMFKKKKA
jgi:hypothetical protein